MNKVDEWDFAQKIDKLQRSKDFERDFTKLYPHIISLQKKYYYELTGRFGKTVLDECEMYDEYCFSEKILDCINGFNLQKGVRFSTYLKSSMRNEVINKSRNIRKDKRLAKLCILSTATIAICHEKV